MIVLCLWAYFVCSYVIVYLVLRIGCRNSSFVEDDARMDAVDLVGIFLLSPIMLALGLMVFMGGLVYKFIVVGIDMERARETPSTARGSEGKRVSKGGTANDESLSDD